PGLSPTQPCPQGPAHCRKQCDPDHYVNEDGYCTACVTCLEGLVETAPCSWNSSRVCECQSGTYCMTPAVNSCARCSLHSRCSGGQVVKFPASLEPGSSFIRHTPFCMAIVIVTPVLGFLWYSTASTLSLLVDAQTSSKMQPTSPLSTGTPFLDPGPMLLWLAMVMLLVGSSSFFLCHWKACRRRIQQSRCLCLGVLGRVPALCWPALSYSCSQQPKRSESVTDASTGHKLSPVNSPTVETCTNVGAAFLESLPLLDEGTAGNPLTPREPPETRVSTEHTNNRIEKIYIMKADTVIVGSVKTEVPEGRGLAGSPEPELEAALEVDHAPHYPEQETEPPLGSCTEVMFSVEEGGKEDHEPTMVSEK
ncbi:Tumor necrosis factor receptor superfamily member 8, partial [Lemmus lemmus]